MLCVVIGFWVDLSFDWGFYLWSRGCGIKENNYEIVLLMSQLDLGVVVPDLIHAN